MPRPKSSHTLILEAALAGLEAQRRRVDEQIAQVRSLLRPRAEKRTVAQPPAKPKRTMGAAARRRIAAAQRKRWAALKKAQQGK